MSGTGRLHTQKQGEKSWEQSGNRAKSTPIGYGLPTTFSGINFLHSQGFPRAECYPWPGPMGPPKHSGVSDIMIPKSALGKSGRPHSQQTEHDSKQLWCPAELLLHPQGPGLPMGMAECKGWHQGSTGGVQYTSVLNYLLFPHIRSRSWAAVACNGMPTAPQQIQFNIPTLPTTWEGQAHSRLLHTCVATPGRIQLQHPLWIQGRFRTHPSNFVRKVV